MHWCIQWRQASRSRVLLTIVAELTKLANNMALRVHALRLNPQNARNRSGERRLAAINRNPRKRAFTHQLPICVISIEANKRLRESGG